MDDLYLMGSARVERQQARDFLGAFCIDPLEGEPAGLDQQVVTQDIFIVEQHQTDVALRSLGFDRRRQAVAGDNS